MALRRPRRSMVVVVGREQTTTPPVGALIDSLSDVGVETVYLGRENDAARIAAAAVDEGADAVEVCLAGGPGAPLLRQLLRELIEIGRREVSIVVHRVNQAR